MLDIREIAVPGYEKVVEGKDPSCGLHCFIAIHDTTLGPSLGGIRIHPYSAPNDALNDALRLAKAMTYKSAVAEDGLGGGKSVIIADPKTQKTKPLLHAFAKVVDSLKGSYIAAEDVGTGTEDMETIREITPYVAARVTEKSSGDPSRFTARGVFRGIQAVAKHLWHSKNLKNKTVAIQGLGHVGAKLAEFLFWEEADLILCDIDEKRLNHYAHYFKAKTVAPNQFSSVECDILSPCALGGSVTPETLKEFNCKAIAGGANNQLISDEMGLALHQKGILYAPDFIINAGGIINAAAEFKEGGYDTLFARDTVNRIYESLLDVFERSKQQDKPTNLVANDIAEYKLAHKIGQRETAIKFSS